MKKKYLFVCVLGLLLLLCSCGNGENRMQVQVGKAAFELPSDCKQMWTTPAPAQTKKFIYDDYNIIVSFVKEDDIKGNLKNQVLSTATEEAVGPTDEPMESIENSRMGELDGMKAYELECSWDTNNDGKPDRYGMATGLDVGYGIYVLTTNAEDKGKMLVAKNQHNLMVDSFQVVDSVDEEVFAAGIGQVGNLLFSMPDWWYRSVADGVVLYYDDMSVVMGIKTVRGLALSETNMVNTLQDMYAKAESVALMEQDSPVKTETGSAVRASFKLQLKDGSTKTSALFVQDEEGTTIACFTVPYDKELKADYTEIIESVQYDATHQSQLENLWEDRTLYVGDNAKASQLAADAGFSASSIELQTENEPYGMTIYTDSSLDLERRCILLLGMIENLDHVKVVTDSQTYYLDVEQANAILRYDVKKLRVNKPMLEAYLLKTLDL